MMSILTFLYLCDYALKVSATPILLLHLSDLIRYKILVYFPAPITVGVLFSVSLHPAISSIL